MVAKQWYVLGVMVLGAAVLWYLLQAPVALGAGQSQEKVRWLLAHEPRELYVHAAEIFSEELEKESDGRLVLEIVTAEDIGLPAGEDVPYETVRALMKEGSIHLSSTYAVSLAKEYEPLGVLSLPFLFADYDSAEHILEGKIGADLLGGLEQAGLRGLAFTYSGGFRIIASQDTEITLANLRGTPVITNAGLVAEETLKALGAIPVAQADAVETTYTRFSQLPNEKRIRTVLETNHSLFLTAIVADGTFYESLSPEGRAALRVAASRAAAVEREDSIELAQKVKSDLVREGLTVVELSREEREAFVQATAPVHDFFADVFPPIDSRDDF